MQVYSCHACLLMSVFGKMTLKDKLTLLSDLAFPRIKTVFHSSQRVLFHNEHVLSQNVHKKENVPHLEEAIVSGKIR